MATKENLILYSTYQKTTGHSQGIQLANGEQPTTPNPPQEEALRMLESVKHLRSVKYGYKTVVVVEPEKEKVRQPVSAPANGNGSSDRKSAASPQRVTVPQTLKKTVATQPENVSRASKTAEPTQAVVSQESWENLVASLKQTLQVMEQRNHLLEQAVAKLIDQQSDMQQQFHAIQDESQQFQPIVQPAQQSQRKMVSQRELKEHLTVLTQRNDRLQKQLVEQAKMPVLAALKVKHNPKKEHSSPTVVTPLVSPAKATTKAPSQTTAERSQLVKRTEPIPKPPSVSAPHAKPSGPVVQKPRTEKSKAENMMPNDSNLAKLEEKLGLNETKLPLPKQSVTKPSIQPAMKNTGSLDKLKQFIANP